MTNKKEFGKQVKQLFSLCVESEAEQHAAIIQASDFSEAVKQRVRSLLKHQNTDDSQLTKRIAQSAQLELGLSVVKRGDIIEQYRLLEQIGQGGQGEVWLAQRDDGEFSHQVAIKFIKLSYNKKELQRFQTERELLASLQHANIAGLIGGGQFEDRLYMIMEWIDGVPLIQYLQQNPLNLTETLNLFLQICQAVSFAHTQGIIHRDIKPSNILVNKHGVVKLLDFGIAKTLDADVTQTQSAAMMTLAYSSPEQINGHAVSTATDVYALGLILYELLTSHRAQNHTTESTADYIRIISDVTPVKPSLAQTHDHAKFTSHQLKGDLDNLVMMAIRKEPQRRYKTVNAFIADIQNYLQSKPLLASGDSFAYKTGKLLKRNPLASLLTAIVLAFLIGFPIVMLRTNQKLNIKTQEALEQAEIANATSDFVTTLLLSATPLGNKGEKPSLDDVLNQAERQLTSGAITNPIVQIQLYQTFARIHHNLKNNKQAAKYYQKAVEISKSVADDKQQLKSLGQLAIVLFRDSQIEQSYAVLQQADDLSKQIVDIIALSWYQLNKSTIENEKGNGKLALDLAEDTLNTLIAHNIQDPEILGRTYNELAIADSAYDINKAVIYEQKAIDYAVKAFGKVHSTYLGRVNSQVSNLLKLGRYSDAEKLLLEALPIAEKLYSKQNPEYTSLLSELSVLWRYQGQLHKAEEARLFALKVVTQFYGEYSFDYAMGLNNLAGIYENMGEQEKAKRLYLKSIKIRRDLDPNNLLRLTSPQRNLARLLVQMGQYQQAQTLIQKVIKLYEKDGRETLYARIISAASFIGDGSDPIQCQLGLQQISDLTPELEKQPEIEWLRMLNEIWIGELAMKCGNTEMGRKFLQSGLAKSKKIYKKGSMGEKMIAQKMKTLLNS